MLGNLPKNGRRGCKCQGSSSPVDCCPGAEIAMLMATLGEVNVSLQDQKKLHDMLLAEKESMYGSKPSPGRSSSFKNANGYRTYGNGSVTPSPRRNSVGSSNSDLLTPQSYSGHQNGYFKETRRLSTAPLNFVAIPKEDTISFSSICGSEPESPQN